MTDDTRTEHQHPENHFFEFHEDGTFIAMLEEALTGTWEFEDLDFQETSIGNYWELDYLLTFDGSPAPERIHIEHRDVLEFWLYLLHLENADHELTLCFRKD